MSIPKIEMYKGYKTLFVDENPFVILGGEIHNSAASSREHMEIDVWPNLKELGLNSVVVPIYWECIEPEEGVFDFSSVEYLLEQARREKMRLVLLWFGLWKNAESMYVPSWMKQQKDTYFLCRKASGEAITTISPFCQEGIQKDKNAYCELLKYLKKKDSKEQTVIMIQVENEIGVLGTERDYSAVANALFQEEIPAEMVDIAGRQGTWENVFKEEAGEYFMTWGFSKAVESIAFAGQEIYPLPMYANAWLEQFPWRPGTYPSGGPIMKMAKVWKKLAPSLFTLAPDIYVPYVAEVMDEYTQLENPLFVPEVRKDAVAASYALYAVFGCHGIGFSPFGIEELKMDPDKIDKIPMEIMLALNIDPSAFDIEGSAAYLTKTYNIIGQLLPLYYKCRETTTVQAYVRKNPRELGTLLSFESYDIQINYSGKERFKPESSGVVFQVGADEFYIAGMMSSITFHTKLGRNQKVEIVRLEEGRFATGQWEKGRILNGDEKMRLTLKDMPTIYRVQLSQYS